MSFKGDFGEELQSGHGSNRVQLRDTISTLTSHLANLDKPTEAAGDRASSYITLAGGNKGAVMKADSLEEMLLQQKAGGGDERLSCAWTNSNYQSVNNSIMIDGECHAEDPGVHIEIMDFLEDIDEEEDIRHEKKGKKDKKKKKKGKEDTEDDEEDDDDDDDHEKEGKKVKDKKKEKKETDEDEEHDHEKEGKKVKDKKEKKEKK